MLPENIWLLFKAGDGIAIGITGAFAFVIGKVAELLDYPPKRVNLFELLTALLIGAGLGLISGLQQGWGVPMEAAKGILLYSTGGAVASQVMALTPLGKVFGRAVVIAPAPSALPPLAPVDSLGEPKKPNVP